MKKFTLYIGLLLLITCAKEDSQDPNNAPSQITRQYTLSVSSGDGGSVSGGGTFAEGTQVSLTATPSSGYSFSEWSNGSTTNPLTVTLNSNTSITGNFVIIINSFTLTVTAGEGGSVSGGGEYDEGTEVTITATPDEGYEFTGWSDGELNITNTFNINSNINITADFEIITVDPIPQIIYSTSVQNHEWNDGWYSRERESYPVEFFSAFEYFDYDLDGDLDIFCRVGFYPGQGDSNAANTNNDIRILINNNNTWTLADRDIVDFQPNRAYRKIVAVDIDNDGDLDMIGFNAEDPAPYNGNRTMGGLDLFRFNDGNFYFEEIIPYQEGNPTFFHSGSAADVNNDGWIDLIAGTGKMILNNGDGTFQNSAYDLVQGNSGGMDWYSQSAIDLNNDGYTDIIAGKSHDSGEWFFPMGGTEELYGKTQWVYWGKAEYPYFDMDNPLILPTNYDFFGTDDLISKGLASTMDISIVDFDKDNLLDIFVLSHSPINPPYGDGSSSQLNVIEYYKNNGDNTFTNETWNIFGTDGENELPNSKTNYWKVRDFDKDGDLEILLEVEEYPFTHFKKGSTGKYYKTID